MWKIPRRLLFTISLDKQVYMVKEEILVTANLKNTGESTVKVSEMLLELETLDFIILTPNHRKIHYIGEVIKRDPDVIELAPGKSIELVVDLTSEQFGDENGEYESVKTGQYTIVGIYRSKEPLFGEDTRANGILKTGIEIFEIKG